MSYIVYDLEIREGWVRGQPGANGFDPKWLVPMSVGVTFDDEYGFREWWEPSALYAELLLHDPIIGFATMTFDNGVLAHAQARIELQQEYDIEHDDKYEDDDDADDLMERTLALKVPLDTRSVDLLAEIAQARPEGLTGASLHNIAIATLGLDKTASGGEAILWWQCLEYLQNSMTRAIAFGTDAVRFVAASVGELRRSIADYCKQDVALTHELYRYGEAHGEVKIAKPDGVETVTLRWHDHTTLRPVSDLRRMLSRYGGICTKCGKRYAVGDPILWSKTTGALHDKCPAP